MDLIISQLQPLLSEYCYNCLLAQLHAILLSVSQGLGTQTPHFPDSLHSLQGWPWRSWPELRKQEDERSPYFPSSALAWAAAVASHSSQLQITVMVAQLWQQWQRTITSSAAAAACLSIQADRGFRDLEPPVGLLASCKVAAAVIPAQRWGQGCSRSLSSTALRGAGQHLFPFRSSDLRGWQLPVVLWFLLSGQHPFPSAPAAPLTLVQTILRVQG